MNHLSAFEKEAIRLGLLKMFEPGGHFSICTVEQLCHLAGVQPPRRTMDALHALHCVSWRSMSKAMRDETAKVVLGLFEHDGFDLPTLDASFLTAPETPHVRGGFFARLLGNGVPQ